MAEKHVTPAITAPTFIDLFSGCGGFSGFGEVSLPITPK